MIKIFQMYLYNYFILFLKINLKFNKRIKNFSLALPIIITISILIKDFNNKELFRKIIVVEKNSSTVLN